MPATDGDVWSVEGGNAQLPDRLLAAVSAAPFTSFVLHKRSRVTSVTRDVRGYSLTVAGSPGEGWACRVTSMTRDVRGYSLTVAGSPGEGWAWRARQVRGERWDMVGSACRRG